MFETDERVLEDTLYTILISYIFIDIFIASLLGLTGSVHLLDLRCDGETWRRYARNDPLESGESAL